MKCDDCLGYLEAGNVLQQLFARRHAARCPQCAASLRDLNEIKQALTAAEPLSPEQRALWQRAAAEEVPRAALPAFRLRDLNEIKQALTAAEPLSPAQRALWQRAAAEEVPRAALPAFRLAAATTLAVVVLLVAVVGAWRLWFGGRNEPTPGAPPRERLVVEQEERKDEREEQKGRPVDEHSRQRIRDIKSGLIAMSEDLERLSRSAALLDERKHVDELLLKCQTSRNGG
ncbi:MAG: hypothetical protein ACYTG0_40720 [Planctomycetota bacterium]|jgi:hypothetical protein